MPFSEPQQHDLDYAELIREKCNTDDPERDHGEADNLLCSLLLDLGFRETVDAWREIEKWYA